MRWWNALKHATRNGIDSADIDLERALPAVDPVPGLGTVPLDGYGGLTCQEVASAGASLAVRSTLPTIEDVQRARERLEVFVERSAGDVTMRNLSNSYWELQSAPVDTNDEAATLAAEMDRIGHVEGAAIVGWVIRNAAIRAQRPIANLARPAEDVSADAMSIAETVLESAQRLDPTFGGFVFDLQARPHSRLRFRDQFGHLWVYGD